MAAKTIKLPKIAFSVVLLAGLSAITPVAGQQSTGYSMDRVAIAAISGTSSSTNFETTIVIGPPVGATSVCGFGFSTGLGFWSVLGVLPIPIELRAGKSGDPVTTELSWTGSTGQFEVYRAANPVGLIDPANLFDVTVDCGTSDVDPSSTVFYTVISAPAP